MKGINLAWIFVLLFFTAPAFAQTSWLDRPFATNWNSGNGIVPAAPRTTGSAPNSVECRDQVRTPDSIADRAVTRAGWFLFGPSQSYGAVTVITAMASVDGMCRPNQYNGFVFVGNRFAGTLAPQPSGARRDGALGEIRLFDPSNLTAEFARYTSTDPLCCPSQTSLVSYSISSGARAVVNAEQVSTTAACQDEGGVETQDNVVSGTVTYRQRIALPDTAVLSVRLLDVTRQDISAVTIAEQRIQTAGKQVPLSFDIVYEPGKIDPKNRYSVRAEIYDGGRLLFTTGANVPVITQGNPRVIDMVLVPVGGAGRNQGSGVIRGSVAYRERILLPPNAEVNVSLVDAADPNGIPVAETTFETSGRQVPIPFELRYEPRNIVRGRNYELRAEIRTAGEARFRTESGHAIAPRPNRVENVDLVLVAAEVEPDVITGQTLSLSKFGTGSMQIEGRSSELLIRASVTVRSDGTADVTVSRLLGSVTFSGKLIRFAEDQLTIMVENSGDADASGEIEVRYSGRSLNSITATNLVLDSQNVTLRF